MTSEEVKTTVKTHRKSAFLGVAVGVVLVGGYFAAELMLTPAEPEVQTAPVGDVVAYVIDSRGLEKLSDIEQTRLLDRWKERIIRDEAYKSSLKDSLLSLPDADRKAFTDAIFKQLKRTFINDALQFSQLASGAAQSEFCRKRVEILDAERAFLTDLAGVFKGDFPGPDKFQEWIISHTSAAERQLGEPYIDALKRVRTQIKKEERAKPSAQG